MDTERIIDDKVMGGGDGCGESSPEAKAEMSHYYSTARRGSAEPATQTETSGMPAPPRWRFVTDAKKTSGYSSVAAGKVVKGFSSDELVGIYNAPQVTIGEAAGESLEVSAAKADAGSRTQREKLNNSVGRLCFRDQDGEADGTFDWTFARFRSGNADAEMEGKRKKAPRGHNPLLSWSDNTMGSPPTKPETAPATLKSAAMDDDFDKLEKQVKVGRKPVVAREETFAPTPPPSAHSFNEQSFDELEIYPVFSDEQKRPQQSKSKPKKWRTVLLLFIGFLIGATVGGIVVNKTRSKVEHDDSGNNNRAVNGVVEPRDEVEQSSEANGLASVQTPDHERQREHEKQLQFAIWAGPNDPTTAPTPKLM